MVEHKSDCSLHNAPAYIPGPCDCGADPTQYPDLDRCAQVFADKHGSFVLQYDASDSRTSDALPWAIYLVDESTGPRGWAASTILEALTLADKALDTSEQ